MKYCLLILVCLCGLPNNISSYRQQNYGRILKWPYIHQINTHQRQQQLSQRFDKEIISNCPLFEKHSKFLIIGHAGGDPVNFCENTLASTRSALKNGANAIEVDVAISKDNVVFLWHDPYPLGIVALARRLGFILNGRCQPSMSNNQPASQITWNQIQKNWFYDDLLLGGIKSTLKIPSLKEWLQEFSDDPRLQLIWLDVKIGEEKDLKRFVKAMHTLLSEHQIPPEKIQFSTHKEGMGNALKKELLRYGLSELASHVVVDTVPYMSYTQPVSAYNAISKAWPGKINCGCCANIGKPIVAMNRWNELQNLVSYNVELRNRLFRNSGTYISVFVWTIDDPDQMKWLLESGIDGIITNRPGLLFGQVVRHK